MSGILRGCRIVLPTLLVVIAGEPASAQIRLDNPPGVHYADDLVIDALTCNGREIPIGLAGSTSHTFSG
jgi:hypothetical protein